MSLALMVLTLTALESQATRPQLAVEIQSPAEAVRCAGLSQAASELDAERGTTAEAKRLYDAGLYWALTAMQAARSTGRTEEAAEADQTRSRTEALARLREGSADAQADLARCLARTPTLD